MICQQFIDPEVTETPHDVAIHNLIESDTCLNLTSFSMAVCGYMKVHPNYNYQDIEQVCRNLKLNTHLFASKVKYPVQHPDKKTECKYEIVYSCRPYQNALAEVLEHWPSYEKNYEALALAGNVVIKDTELSSKEMKQLTYPDTSQQLIRSNKKKLVVTIINTVPELSEYLKKLMGKTPEPKLIGLHHTGAPIFAFYIDGKQVSDYGFVQYPDKIAKIVKIRTY